MNKKIAMIAYYALNRDLMIAEEVKIIFQRAVSSAEKNLLQYITHAQGVKKYPDKSGSQAATARVKKCLKV